MEESKMHEYDCFISYKHATRKTATRVLYLVLRIAGLRPWVDWQDLAPGHNDDNTGGGARCCRHFVVIYSDEWWASEHCRAELHDWEKLNPGKKPTVLKFGDMNPKKTYSDDLYLDLGEIENWA